MRAQPFAWIAWLVYASSWFVPVATGVSGWEAFRLSLSLLRPYEGYATTLVLLSVLTNVVMVLSPLLFLKSRSGFMLFWGWGWASVAALAINAFWLLRGDSVAVFQAGYYLWWLSFVPLVIACFVSVRRSGP